MAHFKRQAKEAKAELRFGAGISNRASESDIQPSEAAEGYNFDIDLDNKNLRPRRPFALKGTAPNAGEIRGFAQLEKQDGSISTLIQAAGNVYEWDGAAAFTLRGTVDSGAKLRGGRLANYGLYDYVIITDIEKAEVVKKWDGTSFTTHNHNLTGDGGQFYAKYCQVVDERVFFANVRSGTDTPHMIVGSTLGDPETLSISDKPTSALGLDDPFYLLSPNLKPVNGFAQAFGRFLFSTTRGNIHSLEGASAQDYYIRDLYPDSGATGDESVVFAGNDVYYGRQGSIETIAGAEAFGDIENDDVTRDILPSVRDVLTWRLIYNPRHKKVYAFADDGRLWVFTNQ